MFISGVAQVAGTDFIASGSTISLGEKGLNDIELRAGDVLVIYYIKMKSDSVLGGSSTDTDMLKILMADAYVLTYHNAGTHNCLYRGKDLGSKLTEEQSTAIRAGTFEGIYVGDYWTFENMPYGWETYYGSSVSGTYNGPIRMRVADCDYYFNTGETALETHHFVIVPDDNISGFDNSMNDNLTTEGGYVGSRINHQEYLVNAVTNRNSLGCKQFNLFRHRPDLICSREPYRL